MSLKVTPLKDGLWHVEWREGDKLIDNVFEWPEGKVPVVHEMTNVHGDIILFARRGPHQNRGTEVGRYNERWAGEEVPCGDSTNPNPVPEDEWVTD